MSNAAYVNDEGRIVNYPEYNDIVEDCYNSWKMIADRNGGWKIRSLNIWINDEGSVMDSVAIKSGNGIWYVYDYETEEPLGSGEL